MIFASYGIHRQLVKHNATIMSSDKIFAKFLKHCFPKKCPDLKLSTGIVTDNHAKFTKMHKKIFGKPYNTWSRDHLGLLDHLIADMKFKTPGKSTRLNGFKYAELKDCNVTKNIITIPCKNNFMLHLMEGSKPKNIFNMFIRCSKHNLDVVNVKTGHKSVRFPNVVENDEPNCGKFVKVCSIQYNRKPYKIQDMKQSVRVSLDHKGTKVEARTRIVATKGKSPEPFTITKPFYYWLTHTKYDGIIVCAYFDKNSWVK